MGGQKNEALYKRVISFYNLHTKYDTVQHFHREGINKNTIYSMLRRYDETGRLEYRKITGRPISKSTPVFVNNVKRLFTNNRALSTRVAARKLKVSQGTVMKIKKDVLGIRAYKKRSAPKYIKNQKQRAKTGCKKVYEKQLTHHLVIDDETYVAADPSDISAMEFFHATHPKSPPYEDRVKAKAKFFKKYLVWQALDEKGRVSRPYVCEGSLNSVVYLRECIMKLLVPFIDEVYDRSTIIFWPDLSTVHYANIVTSYLREAGIQFVPKVSNPPNVPQCRGIEKFWALVKREYHKYPKAPKNLRGFSQVWYRLSQIVARRSGKAVMDSALRNLRNVGYKGLDGAF